MVNHFKSNLTQLPLVFKGEFIEKHTRLSKNYVVTELGTCKVTMDQQEKQCLYVDLSNGSKPKWSGKKKERGKRGKLFKISQTSSVKDTSKISLCGDTW